MYSNKKVHILLIILISIVVVSCKTSSDKIPAAPPLKFSAISLEENYEELFTTPQQYKIGVGDELKISIFDHPKVSSTATAFGNIIGDIVDENGEINIPLVKRVKIDGMTRKEIGELLEEKYSEFIKVPHVMVDIVKYNSQFFFITGGVRTPGKFPIQLNTSVMDAVTKLIPLSEEGTINTIFMKREAKVITINLAEIGKSEKDYSKLYLKGGDTFYVSPSSAERIFIIGEVKRPGAYSLTHENYTLLDLIAESGGINPSTSFGAIYLVRPEGSKNIVAQIDFDDVFNGKVNPKLYQGDRVLVSPDALTSYNRIIMRILPTFQLINTGTGSYKNIKDSSN